MKLVVLNSRFHAEKCVGCKTCAHVCPTMAYTLPRERPAERFKIAPCAAQCPMENDIEGFISFIGQKRYPEAYHLLLKTNPFPGITGRVCHHPCEQSCNRMELDEGISIQALERFVSDRARQEGYEGLKPRTLQREKVAVIGSGPAGLSCAYFLARAGYRVTVFESAGQIGGLLRFGIPEYRLPEAVLDWEIEKLRFLKVKFQPRRQFGKNLQLTDLKDFAALFLATGFQKSHLPVITGETSPGVFPALDFLKKVNSGQAVRLGKKAAVIGGGNAAMDAARAARRLGCEPVILYRRTSEEMTAFPDERQELKREGIEFHPLVIPKRIIVEKGQIRQIECLRSRLGKEGRDGRRIPVPIPDSEFILDVDNVILAVGAGPDFSGFPASWKFKKSGLIADSAGATRRQGTFAGGDVATAAGTVSGAIASGKKGAMAIRRFLKEEAVKRNGLHPETVHFEELNPDYFYPAPKISPRHLDAGEAIQSFAEVRFGYTEGEAQGEAQRCLGCAAPPQYHEEDCRGCTNCEQRCPASAISIERREQPVWVGVDPGEFNAGEILEICTRAKVHPQQIVCYCTNTTAGEIAAAILKGAHTPEAISRMTGARTGCTVLCIQSILKLLKASGQTLAPAPTHQVYATINTLWDVKETTKGKYASQGYHFEEDRELLEGTYKKE